MRVFVCMFACILLLCEACNCKITTIETHRDARYWYFIFFLIPRLSPLMRRNYDTMTRTDVY